MDIDEAKGNVDEETCIVSIFLSGRVIFPSWFSSSFSSSEEEDDEEGEGEEEDGDSIGLFD